MRFPEGYRQKNFPPSEANGRNVCPNYSLLEICSKLDGITEINKVSNFCGELQYNHDDIGPLCGWKGKENKAVAICSKINNSLGEKIDLVKTHIKIESEDDFKTKLNQESDIDKKKEMLDEFIEKQKNIKKQNSLMNEWREITFNNCKVPSSEKQDVKHFKKVTKPEDLSEEQVILYVDSFYSRLNEIIGEKH